MNKMSNLINRSYILLIAVVAVSLMGGFIGAREFDRRKHLEEIVLSEQQKKEEIIADYYKSENAVGISPHTLRKTMDEGGTNFILVDLRSSFEYEQEHITGAISIPGVSITNSVQFVDKFKELPKDKVIVTYCYSSACMLSRQVGQLLSENGMYTKHLNIGWNEWRYDWQMWNAPSEWATTKPEDYVISGKEPGTPTKKANSAACTAGELGC